MMANHPTHDEAPDENKEEAIDNLSNAVQDVLGRKQTLQTVIADLYSARFRGEGVQEELNALFDNDDELFAMARLAEEDALDLMLDEAIEYDCLTEAEADEFLSFWEEVSWIASGIEAYAVTRNGQPKHWTDKDVEIGAPDGQLLIGHHLSFGADTIHDIEVPAWKFFLDAVQRLQLVTEALPMAIEKGDIGEEEMAEILETHDVLIDIAGRLDNLSSQASADDAGMDNEETVTSTDDPVLTGEDNQTAGDANEDEVMNSPAIGFQ